MTPEKIAELAATETPQPMPGTWTLIAPDGRRWLADSPLLCCHLELKERVPPQVRLARILREAFKP